MSLQVVHSVRDTPQRPFLEHVEASVRESQANGRRFAVLLAGFDRPRGLGAWLEPGADASLRQRAGERLARLVEAGGASGWLHGDTFGLLLPRLHSGLRARETANRVLAAMGPLRASVGIAIYPGDGRDAHGVIGCAAAALARARCEKRPTYRFAFATSAASSSPLL